MTFPAFIPREGAWSQDERPLWKWLAEGVMSLWDMLEIDGKGLENAIYELAALHQLCCRHLAASTMRLREEGVIRFNKGMAYIIALGNDLGAVTLVERATSLRDYLSGLPRAAAFSDEADGKAIALAPHEARAVEAALATIESLIEAALRDQLLFVIERRNARFWSLETTLSTTAEAKFSNAIGEVGEASKCIALDRPTASVFHSMRAMEVALEFLCSELGLVPRNPNWENVLNDLTASINKIGPTDRGTNWKQDKQWFSAAVAHLRTTKLAWRNYVMHGHVNHTEEEARSIFVSVKSFLNDLAKGP